MFRRNRIGIKIGPFTFETQIESFQRQECVIMLVPTVELFTVDSKKGIFSVDPGVYNVNLQTITLNNRPDPPYMETYQIEWTDWMYDAIDYNLQGMMAFNFFGTMGKVMNKMIDVPTDTTGIDINKTIIKLLSSESGSTNAGELGRLFPLAKLLSVPDNIDIKIKISSLATKIIYFIGLTAFLPAISNSNHVQAVQRLVDRLERDGWTYQGILNANFIINTKKESELDSLLLQSLLTSDAFWFAHRFNRPLK